MGRQDLNEGEVLEVRRVKDDPLLRMPEDYIAVILNFKNQRRNVLATGWGDTVEEAINMVFANREKLRKSS